MVRLLIRWRFPVVKSLLKALSGTFLSATLVLCAHAQDYEGGPNNGIGAFNTCVPSQPTSPANRFETSASLLFLQPGVGDLRYATLISPLPALTPHWND